MYIDVDNQKTYIATGSREHVEGNLGMTFIHGTAMDHTVWTLAGRHFARKGLNIQAVDLPGHGRSEGSLIDSIEGCLLYTSPSPRDATLSRMPSSA